MLFFHQQDHEDHPDNPRPDPDENVAARFSQASGGRGGVVQGLVGTGG